MRKLSAAFVFKVRPKQDKRKAAADKGSAAASARASLNIR
jgi:hypothetical protein